MENGHSKEPEIISPPGLSEAFKLICHRFYIPIAVPVPDTTVLAGKQGMRLQATISNVHCIREKCTLWNPDAQECWDVSAAKGQALAGQLAYNKLNDVHIQGEN
jgi:hypothetical protein